MTHVLKRVGEDPGARVGLIFKNDAVFKDLICSGASSRQTVYIVITYDEQGCLYPKCKIHG